MLQNAADLGEKTPKKKPHQACVFLLQNLALRSSRFPCHRTRNFFPYSSVCLPSYTGSPTIIYLRHMASANFFFLSFFFYLWRACQNNESLDLTIGHAGSQLNKAAETWHKFNQRACLPCNSHSKYWWRAYQRAQTVKALTSYLPASEPWSNN